MLTDGVVIESEMRGQLSHTNRLCGQHDLPEDLMSGWVTKGFRLPL
jgi:hypothetical protein